MQEPAAYTQAKKRLAALEARRKRVLEWFNDAEAEIIELEKDVGLWQEMEWEAGLEQQINDAYENSGNRWA